MDELRFITLLYIVFATIIAILCYNPKNYVALTNIRLILEIVGVILFVLNAYYSEVGILETVLTVFYLLLFIFMYILFHESIHAIMIYLLTGKLPKYIYIITNKFTIEGGFVKSPRTSVYADILITSMPLLLTSVYILFLLGLDRYYTIVSLFLFALCILNSIMPGTDFFYILLYAIAGNVLAIKILLFYAFVLSIDAFVLFYKEHKNLMEYSSIGICFVILFYIVTLL